MTNKKIINHIAVILDRSGSMQRTREVTVAAFNEQMDTLQDAEDKQDDRVTLVTFATKVDDPIHYDLSERLKLDDYQPRGSTALYDAIGTTVELFQDIEEQEDTDQAFLILIMSDGQENISKTFNSEKIASIVKELEESGNWTFTFIGADKNCLQNVRQNLNFSVNNTTSYDATYYGTQVAGSGMACGLKMYKKSRGAGGQSISNFYGGH